MNNNVTVSHFWPCFLSNGSCNEENDHYELLSILLFELMSIIKRRTKVHKLILIVFLKILFLLEKQIWFVIV